MKTDRLAGDMDHEVDETTEAMTKTVNSFSGVGVFKENIVPQIADVVKTVERVSRAKALAGQVDKLNRVEMLKQLDDAIRFMEEATVKARTLLQTVSHYSVMTTEADRDEWTRLFVESCHSLGRSVEGQFPTFRVFPIEIKADLANDSVTINNRLVRSLHPTAIAKLVDKEIIRLHRERFNATQFARALVRASEVLLAERRWEEKDHKGSATVLLREIHTLLAVRTGGGMSGYSLNQFIFDLYRLRTQTDLTIDGRRLVFQQTRLAKDTLVIPLPGGQKEILGALEVVALGGEGDA
ncbi:MAG: hypothetical protein OWT28_03690 [Firmicutes bacterium]|nr:hypothetical protein [Bacillota bacterium]